MARRIHPTQQDVAARAGVSVATVSYVLSGRRDRARTSTPEVEQRVRRAASDLGYRPARAGRALRSGTTGLVAVLHYLPLTGWETDVLDQVEDVARERDKQTVLVRYRSSDDSARRACDLVTDRFADAVVAMYSWTLDGLLPRLVKEGPPLLVLGNGLEQAGFDYLHEDQEPGIRAATDLLLDQGAQRIVCITVSDTSPKERAFLDQLRVRGVPDPEQHLVRMWAGNATFMQDMDRTIGALLDSSPDVRPDAIITTSDAAGVATLGTAQRLGIRVPEDLKVVGMGNGPESREARLSTVGAAEPDYRPAIGRLLDRAADPTLPIARHDIAWELIGRDST